MVTPDVVRRVIVDAARLVKRGEIIVFGSASLAFWLQDAPRSRDVDIWVVPEERGELVEAVMGELSWYHERHDAYVEVLGPETFEAPRNWRERAREMKLPDAPDVVLIVAHPHDVLVAKVARYSDADKDHIRRILAEIPLDRARLAELSALSPNRTSEDPNMVAAFDAHIAEVMATLPG